LHRDDKANVSKVAKNTSKEEALEGVEPLIEEIRREK
jgi:hypothetical protein